MINVILNEKDYIENVIETGMFSTKLMADIELLAKYYMWQGLTPKQTKAQIDQILEKSIAEYNKVLWCTAITDAICRKKGEPLLEIDYIGVTKNELDCIAALRNKKLERLMFTLLCLAKYGNVRNSLNNDWVSVKRYKLTGIFVSAKVVGGEVERCRCIKKLKDAGMLEYSKAVDNTNVRVTIVDRDNKAAAIVKDFSNLGYEYRRIRGEAYLECDECGHLTKKRGNAQKYCPVCAKMMKTEAKRRYRKIKYVANRIMGEHQIYDEFA